MEGVGVQLQPVCKFLTSGKGLNSYVDERKERALP